MNNSKETSISSGIEEKLSALGPNIDLTQGPPINQKRTVTFINHFVISMVEFLNKFAQSCEYKLFICDQKIKKLEDELCLLETKLNSVPDVADIRRPTPVNQTHEELSNEQETNVTNLSNEEEKGGKQIVKPELAKYIRMVNVGVPVQAVKLKMQQEGLDPNLLQTND